MTPAGGWTPAEPVGQDLPQTYIGLACGPDDTLHLVYRLWRYGEPPYPNSHHATLAYSRKRPGQPWEAPRVLVVRRFRSTGVLPPPHHRPAGPAVSVLRLLVELCGSTGTTIGASAAAC